MTPFSTDRRRGLQRLTAPNPETLPATGSGVAPAQLSAPSSVGADPRKSKAISISPIYQQVLVEADHEERRRRERLARGNKTEVEDNHVVLVYWYAEVSTSSSLLLFRPYQLLLYPLNNPLRHPHLPRLTSLVPVTTNPNSL